MSKSILIVGSLNTDMVLRTERQPRPGETLHAQSFRMHTGGKGANQAAAIARLGGKAMLLGCVGRDALASPLLDELTATGVDITLVSQVEASTGVALISVTPSGENTILLSAGANAELLPELLHRHRERIASAAMVLTQLETPLDTLEALALLCEESGTPLMLDPAPAQTLSPQTLRRIAWLTPNETEAALLFGTDVVAADAGKLKTLADHVLRSGPAICC